MAVPYMCKAPCVYPNNITMFQNFCFDTISFMSHVAMYKSTPTIHVSGFMYIYIYQWCQYLYKLFLRPKVEQRA